MNILLHVLVSIFGDFTSVLGQGKQVRLYFFTSQCLYLEILHQCCGRGSKFDYSFSCLSVYIWRLYVSVGAEEASLAILLHVSCISVYLEMIFCVSVGVGKAS